VTSSSIFRAVSILICAFLPIATPGFSQTAGRNSDEQRLIEIERELNEADAHHNVDLTSKYLDDAYLIKSIEGKVYDKSATLESMRLEAAAEQKTAQRQPVPVLEGLKAAVLDRSALVVFQFTVGADKQTLHCQTTDTFLKRTDDWKLVGRAATCH
jgi:uncharacterized protein DUF4440